MSAICVMIGQKRKECEKEVLSLHGGAGEGEERTVRQQAAYEVCSSGFNNEQYHKEASDRFEAQVPKTREEMKQKEESLRAIGRVVLPIVFGPIALFFRK
jgi:hypothetical protein